MEADHRSPQTMELERILAPLDEEEAERAIRSAVADLAERTSRYRVLGTQLAIEKPQGEGRVQERVIEVLVADYDNRHGLRLLVGTDDVVTERQVLDYEPAFSPEEISEARQLAERDEHLAELARRDELVLSTFWPSTAQVGERHIGLRYALSEEDLVRLVVSVVVNLSVGEVLGPENQQHEEGGP